MAFLSSARSRRYLSCERERYSPLIETPQKERLQESKTRRPSMRTTCSFRPLTLQPSRLLGAKPADDLSKRTSAEQLLIGLGPDLVVLWKLEVPGPEHIKQGRFKTFPCRHASARRTCHNMNLNWPNSAQFVEDQAGFVYR